MCSVYVDEDNLYDENGYLAGYVYACECGEEDRFDLDGNRIDE